MSKRNLWIGIGIGAAAGLTTGYIVGSITTKRRMRRDHEAELKRTRHNAYIRAHADAEAEARQVIDELTANVILVDPNDPEAVAKAVEQAKNIPASSTLISSTPSNNNTEESSESETASEDDDEDHSDEKYAEKPENENVSKRLPIQLEGQYAIFTDPAGVQLYYPRSILENERGELYDNLRIRENFRMYEPDIHKLKVVWNSMGWGTYIPELDGPPIESGLPSDEEINNWDLSIEDESDVKLGAEPEVKSEERSKWIEKVNIYKANPDAPPRMISKQDFDEESHLEQIYIDYYAVDNVFAENTDPTKPIDAVALFGTADGQALFDRKEISEDDPDPDILHMENFKHNCVIELTRYHKSYAGVLDGSAYLNGNPG